MSAGFERYATPEAEARAVGLKHAPGCPAERVDVFDATRPGVVREIVHSHKNGWRRTSYQRGPSTVVRVVRCLSGCRAQLVLEPEVPT